jgi:hypothetical protein
MWWCGSLWRMFTARYELGPYRKKSSFFETLVCCIKHLANWKALERMLSLLTAGLEKLVNVGVKFWASIFGSGCSRGTAALESGNVPRASRRLQAARINTTNRHATVAANVSCSQDTTIRKLCPRYDIRFTCNKLPLLIYDNAAEYLPYS